ncbi:hypothetical protein GCM10010170_097830 [Dactylosporangium salmoneum]|uniref:Uncharacterized protein n=1 Tax=Dactylosporangium salmoneum TaxID=53361 RepID=A0ABP5USW9_9ACTN
MEAPGYRPKSVARDGGGELGGGLLVRMLGLAGDYPFIAPDVIPCANDRCSTRYTAMTGRVVRMAAADR